MLCCATLCLACAAYVSWQVSPPLVAFKESVLSGGESYEGVVVKPAKVVEAATPSGACVVRVKAHALPNSTAALLEETAHLLPQLLGQHDRQQQAPARQHTGPAGQRHSMDGSDSSRELQKLRDAYADSLRSADNKQLVRLLERAWLLGPRHVGPNIALCSPAAIGKGAAAGSSLFDVPAAAVIKAASKHGPLAKIAGTQASVPQHQHEAAAVNGAGTADAGAEAVNPVGHEASIEAVYHQHMDIVFGRPTTAAALTRMATVETVANAADAAAVAAAHAAEAAAAAGLGDLWPHITSSVESGVTAGFQLAAGAGPLCDESMWGVVFEVEVRLVLPATGAGGLDLAEPVYGPFSGQVSAQERRCWMPYMLL